MRKWSLLFVVILVVVAATASACGGGATAATTKDDSSSPTTAKATTTEKADPMALPWGGTAELKNLTITVEAPVDETADLGEDAEWLLSEGGKAISCEVTLTNTGKDTYSSSTLAFTLFDTEGHSYDSLMSPTAKAEFPSVDVLSGKTIAGAVAFELPEGAEPSYMLFQPDIMSDTEAHWGD